MITYIGLLSLPLRVFRTEESLHLFKTLLCFLQFVLKSNWLLSKSEEAAGTYSINPGYSHILLNFLQLLHGTIIQIIYFDCRQLLRSYIDFWLYLFLFPFGEIKYDIFIFLRFVQFYKYYCN